MLAVIANIADIKLPEEILKTFNTERLEFIQTEDGIIIKPFGETIKKARGILKKSKFSTDIYFKNKKEDKEFEV